MSTEQLSREKLLALGWTENEIDELDEFDDDLRDVAVATRTPGPDPTKPALARAPLPRKR
jgi:hypothetical protein